MNRVLYQLSYAAIVQVISHHEISFVIISKETRFVKHFSKIFLLYFGNASSEVKNFENCEKYRPFCAGRQRLCWIGTALAGKKSYQHVRCWGPVLSFVRQTTGNKAAGAGETGGRGRTHYRCGAGNRPAGKPGSPCMGLPGSSGEFPGTHPYRTSSRALSRSPIHDDVSTASIIETTSSTDSTSGIYLPSLGPSTLSHGLSFRIPSMTSHPQKERSALSARA